MLVRSSQNPLLTPAELRPSQAGMEVACLLNPGVFHFAGKTWLLLRVAERPKQSEEEISFPILNAHNRIQIINLSKKDPGLDLSDPRVITYEGNDYLTTMSHLRLVSSEDGICFSEEPGYAPIFPSGQYEAYGIEDCRVTQIGERYYLTYTAVSSHGVAVGMKSTQDWQSFKDYGLILPPHNKDCALFDRPIEGTYYMLHRPSSPEIGGNYIWIAESKDLTHWGNHKCIAHSRKGTWDSARVGAGCAPILLDDGWLAIYHGADQSNRYCLGALLLDKKDPSKVLARSVDPFMEPTERYETNGFFGKVIFTNGHIVNGNTITIYYGAADSVICRADVNIVDIIKTLK